MNFITFTYITFIVHYSETDEDIKDVDLTEAELLERKISSRKNTLVSVDHPDKTIEVEVDSCYCLWNCLIIKQHIK